MCIKCKNWRNNFYLGQHKFIHLTNDVLDIFPLGTYCEWGHSSSGNVSRRATHAESLDCSGCPLYDMCIKSERQINKRIQKNMNLEYFKAQVKHQLSTKENRAIYQQRKVDIETVFGNLKANLSFQRFSVRGMRKVKIETGLALLALNIRKLTHMVGSPLENDMKNGNASLKSRCIAIFLSFQRPFVPAPYHLLCNC